MRTKRAPLDPERARQDYQFSSEPIATLALRQGMSRTSFLDWTRAQGLKRRVETVRRPRRGKAELDALTLEKCRKILSRSITGRLYVAIDRKLEEIEVRMQQRAESQLQSAADTECDTRSLNSLARLYAKLVDMDEAAQKAERGSEMSAARSEEDADRLCRDLARRLERLNREGDA